MEPNQILERTDKVSFFSVLKAMTTSDKTDTKQTKSIGGLVSAFNVVDRHGDVVVKGAYSSGLAKNYDSSSGNLLPEGKCVGGYYEHDDLIGGVTFLKETDAGLEFNIDLVDGIQCAEETWILYKSKIIHSASIGASCSGPCVIVDITEDAAKTIAALAPYFGANAASVYEQAKSNYYAKNWGLRILTSMDIFDVTVTNKPVNTGAVLKTVSQVIERKTVEVIDHNKQALEFLKALKSGESK